MQAKVNAVLGVLFCTMLAIAPSSELALMAVTPCNDVGIHLTGSYYCEVPTSEKEMCWPGGLMLEQAEVITQNPKGGCNITWEWMNTYSCCQIVKKNDGPSEFDPVPRITKCMLEQLKSHVPPQKPIVLGTWELIQKYKAPKFIETKARHSTISE